MNEMKLMMQQMELAKMTAAAIQLGQLSITKELLEMSSELSALLDKMASEVAKQQTIIELSR